MGYCISILTIFLYNLGYGLYKKNVSIIGGIISGGWVLSFIPICFICQTIVNPSNWIPSEKVILDDQIFFIYNSNISWKYPYFLYVYGITIILLGSLLSFFLDNPQGIKSNLSYYIEKKLYRKSSRRYNSNKDVIIENSYHISLKTDSLYSVNSKYTISNDNKSIELRSNNYEENEKEIDKLLLIEDFKRHLKSKLFLLLFFNFTIIYSIYVYACLKMKENGIKYYSELFVLKLNTLFLIINFISRIGIGIILKFVKLKNIIILSNILLLFSTFLTLFEGYPFITYILNNIIILVGSGFGITCMRICCKELFQNNKVATSLQGYMENASVVATFFEFLIEVVFSKILNVKVLIIIWAFNNILIISKNLN